MDSEETIDLDSQEQYYWLQLLGDLGSDRKYEVSMDSQLHPEGKQDYFYLDKLPPKNTTDENSSTWLIGKEITRDHESSHHHNFNSSVCGSESIDSPPAIPPPPPPTTEKLSAHNLDQLWANEYPRALEMIRSEMLFHKLEMDLESVNENEDETGFEIIQYSDQPMPPQSQSNLFLLKVPTIPKPTYSMHSMVNTVINILDEIRKRIPIEEIKHYTKESLSEAVRLAVFHLRQVKPREMVNNLVEKVSDSTTYLSDQAYHLFNLYRLNSLEAELVAVKKKICDTEEEARKMKDASDEEGWRILMDDLKEQRGYLVELQKEKNLMIELGQRNVNSEALVKITKLVSIVSKVLVEDARPHAASDSNENDQLLAVMKREACERYHCNHEVDPYQTKCMLLGVHFPTSQVTCSPIISPSNSTALSRLGLSPESLWNAKNGLLLFECFEKPLENLEVTFLLDQTTQTYRFQVLYDDLLTTTIPVLASSLFPERRSGYLTYGDLVGRPLLFPPLVFPYRRCLYFISYFAYRTALQSKRSHVCAERSNPSKEEWEAMKKRVGTESECGEELAFVYDNDSGGEEEK